jgi:hypothetical protein
MLFTRQLQTKTHWTDRLVFRSLQLFSNLNQGGTNMKRLLSFFAIVVLLGAQSLQAQWIQTNGL